MNRFSAFATTLLIGALVVWVTGCSLTPSNELDSTDSFVSLVEEKQVDWEEEDILSYDLRYNRLLDTRLYRGVTISVRQDTISEARFNGEPVSVDNLALTVDDMYQEMLALLRRDGRGAFNVRFNDTNPYPARYSVSSRNDNPAIGLEIIDFVIPDEPQ